MKVLTIKSVDALSEALQTEVHHVLGMEHFTDYVFKARGDQQYTATIVLERSAQIISKIIASSADLPDQEFILDDLDMEENTINRIRIKAGEVTETRQSGWDWDK
ncbi:MAG: hypothetical protein CSA96_01135 [Bacteroidetes bacterium]|nr:MAG: hypothetical protein CSA96_01135 [Bacteroidota bacterium]